MFLAPLAQRLLHGLNVSPQATELTTTAFWATFPSWPVALVTFLVCGFGAVYLLGSKGFCTYGCPYGGIFGLVDQLAPVRIRVTDACEGCGHCTAVCTSNVKVHQEVRDYGAVVDPGCMKCLDCVSVCPKDALYVGFGAPAIVAKPRTKLRLDGGEGVVATILDFALLGAFFAGAFAVLFGFDEDLTRIPGVGILITVLTALCLAVAAVFRGKARRKREYSRTEEALLAGTFLLAMYAFRGFRDWVPLLFALGLASILAYLAVQALRFFYRNEVRIQRHVLRVRGRWTRAGTAFAVTLVPVVGLWAWAGWSKHELRSAYQEGVAEAEAGRFDAAIRRLQRAVAIDPGYRDARSKLGSLLCDVGRLPEGIAQFEAVLERNPEATEARALLALALYHAGNTARAREELERAVERSPFHPDLREMLAELCTALGDSECAARQRAEAERLRAAPERHEH
jgi:NAD-dependent dihydropyrimidine dehydrogenase PreA subunit